MFENHGQEPMDYKVEPVEHTRTPYEQYYQNPQQAAPESPREPKKHGGAKIVALALVCALLGGAGGGALTMRMMADQAAASGNGQTVEQPSDSGAQSNGLALSTVVHRNTGDKELTPAEVYDQNVNAVVGISTEATTTNIFGQVSSAICSGSGFIITEDGYVVTNNHVIANANKITVTLYDGTEYEATLVGTEPSNDVALLKIDGTSFPTVKVGDSNDVNVGDQVVAIGNPLGELTFTLTAGYVSALDREINTDGTPINMMQTDVAINSGNSGGPLFDMNGNVIGITTAKYSSNSSTTASIEGIGFAIPIDDAMAIVDDLKQYGYVTGKPQLGVTVRDFDTNTAAIYGLPAGVYVDSVSEDSAASKAGIQKGDIITGMNGETVENYTEMSAMMKKLKAGQTITIDIFRNGQQMQVSATLDERPATNQQQTTQETETDNPQNQTVNPFAEIFGGNGWFPAG